MRGKTLKDALCLAEVGVTYKEVKGKKGFIQEMNRLAKRFAKRSEPTTQLPYIHISAHGDAYKIKFTNGSSLNWRELRELFEGIDKKIGRVQLRDRTHPNSSRLVLCFSTCEGYNAHNIYSKAPCPFQSIIGPVEKPDWTDSLLAFQVFYHATNYRQRRLSFDKAVELMNTATGLNNVFQLFKSPELR